MTVANAGTMLARLKLACFWVCIAWAWTVDAFAVVSVNVTPAKLGKTQSVSATTPSSSLQEKPRRKIAGAVQAAIEPILYEPFMQDVPVNYDSFMKSMLPYDSIRDAAMDAALLTASDNGVFMCVVIYAIVTCAIFLPVEKD